MNVRVLIIMTGVLGIGVGSKLAYDAYQDTERQNQQEIVESPVGCSLCSVHKADLKRLREQNEQRSLLEQLETKAAPE